MKKPYIYTSAIPMTIKLGRMVTCDGGTPTSMSCDILIICSRDKWRRNYTWTSTILIANKLCRVVTYARKTTHIKLHGLLITWSRDKCKTLYLHFCSAYDHKAGQSNNLPWGDPTLKVTWPFDYVVRWQMKKIYVTLTQYLWPPNLEVGGPNPSNPVIVWSRDHVKI